MDTCKSELVYELPGHIKVYKDGHVERLLGTDFTSPSPNPSTGVSSKDVIVIPELNISARLYLPILTRPNQKLPLLVYFHGGAFCINSPFCSVFHNYVSRLVAEANVVAVSVDYRKAPEHPIPTAYEDSWAALQWAVSHCNQEGPEPWLNEHADFGRVFLSGESSGANIAHNLAIAGGKTPFGLLGVVLVHPYFWGSDSLGSEMLALERKAVMDGLWPFVCPSNPSSDDPRINPVVANGPGLAGLACKRVLVCVAENDVMRDRGRVYYEVLGRSGWVGVVEIFETEGEGHGFHLFDLECEKAKELIQRLAAFFNTDMALLR